MKLSKALTTADNYFTFIEDRGAGTLFYLAKKKDGKEGEMILESVLIDTTNRDLTLKILERTMKHPNFLAFPGTPEFYEIVGEFEKSL